MKEPNQFIVNERGEKVAVIVSIEDYNEIIERLEDLEDICAYDDAKASGEIPIPLEEALARIERSRK